ncbi:MAG: ACT domain-containing protein [Thermacetogeniaceae bacterium]
MEHLDRPGVIGRVATVLGNNRININEMRLARGSMGKEKLMIIETDDEIPIEVQQVISGLQDVISVIKI